MSQPLKVEKVFWYVNEQKVPVHIHREARRNSRVSFGKSAVLVRFPLRIAPAEEAKVRAFFNDKLIEWLQKKPQSFDKYQPKEYKTGDRIQVGSRAYILDILHVVDKKGHTGQIEKNGAVSLQLSASASDEARRKAVSTLLSRLISWDFKPDIVRRVNELNHLYFRKEIKSVNFKYNHSNWGSCSSTGNLNFSSRLLFAPEAVIDYVIIHELSHLVELNHSDQFWKLVSDAMPDYETHEQWLKKNGHLCRF